MTNGQKYLSYEERLRACAVQPVEEKAQKVLGNISKYPMRGNKNVIARILIGV